MSGLAGKTVLLTRSDEANRRLARLFTERGARTLSLPSVQFVEPDSWEACDAAIRNLGRYQAILFTSANAVTWFLTRLAVVDNSASKTMRTLSLYSIGEKTSEVLEAAGFAVTASPDGGTAEDLAEMLGSHVVAGMRFLFPKSNIARDVLPTSLRELGALVDEIIVYKNVPPTGGELDSIRDALLKHEIDVVTFFSPSAVRNFVQLVGTQHLEHTRVAVIGPTTAEAAESLHMRVDVVASEPTAESLVDSMDRFLTTGSS